jgi:hypothetical protein
MQSCDEKLATLEYLIKYLKEFENIEQKSIIIQLFNDKYYPKIITMLKNIKIKTNNENNIYNQYDLPPQYYEHNELNKNNENDSCPIL